MVPSPHLLQRTLKLAIPLILWYLQNVQLHVASPHPPRVNCHQGTEVGENIAVAFTLGLLQHGVCAARFLREGQVCHKCQDTVVHAQH